MTSLGFRRAVVTGGAGFIGSELVDQLIGRGFSVTAVDSLVNGRAENLDVAVHRGARLIVADIRERDTMAALMRDADVVFHLACLGVRHSLHSPSENHDVNATATLKLLELAREAGVARFLYVSTSEVYGTARWAPMAEDHPTLPMTVYGASKLAGECYARAFHRTYGYPTVVVRPFNTYGPRSHHEGDCGEVIPKFLLHCMAGREMVIFGDGQQTRDFTFVSDTAHGILGAALADNTVGETVNLGQGREIAINELANLVARVVGVEPRVVFDAPRPGDVLRLCSDTTRARQLFGFAPRVSFEAGLARLRDWYLQSEQSVEALLHEERVRNWEPAGVPV